MDKDPDRTGNNPPRDTIDLMAVGTSVLVQPAAWLPISALEAGAQVIQVNPEPTDLSDRARFDLRGKAGEILPALIQSVWRNRT